MNTMCSGIETLWNSIYNTLFVSLNISTRVTIGLILLILSIIFFIQSSKGKKSELVGNWFWFWISMITFILSILYLSQL